VADPPKGVRVPHLAELGVGEVTPWEDDELRGEDETEIQHQKGGDPRAEQFGLRRFDPAQEQQHRRIDLQRRPHRSRAIALRQPHRRAKHE
jgi:hypothetical protein